jgi:hypothetical protein
MYNKISLGSFLPRSTGMVFIVPSRLARIGVIGCRNSNCTAYKLHGIPTVLRCILARPSSAGRVVASTIDIDLHLWKPEATSL